MVLRRMYGPRSEEVTGEWRRLHNEELYGLYCSPNVVRVIKCRRMRWAGHVARMGEERGVYRVLVGKLEGKRPYAIRPGCSSPPGKTRYPLYRSLSGPQGQSGQVENVASHWDSIPRPSSPVAQSLYRLSYRAH